MTHLTKPVTRSLISVDRRGNGKNLVVTLAPEGIRFREKGRRTSFLLPYAVGEWTAIKLAADAILRDRKAARAAKRITRRAAR
jgi:hypothetical protein